MRITGNFPSEKYLLARAFNETTDAPLKFF